MNIQHDFSEDYMIDAYLDKNMTDNDDAYVAVKLALKSYQQSLSLRQSAKKDDVTLLVEIASIYNDLLDTADHSLSCNILLKRVSEMVNLAQEILASYSLHDIKNDLFAKFGSKINLNYKVDKDLISGLIIQVGSIMIDNSMKNKLKQIKSQMIEV